LPDDGERFPYDSEGLLNGSAVFPVGSEQFPVGSGGLPDRHLPAKTRQVSAILR